MLQLLDLDALDCMLRRIHGNIDKPFGGVHVLFCGDLFQLNPVGGRAVYSSSPRTGEARTSSKPRACSSGLGQRQGGSIVHEELAVACT